MSKDRPNKVVLKEGFVVLTGDPIAAIVLNQMLYWSERRNDADSFILEELQRESPDAPPPDGSHGWIYKSSEELAGELMGLGSDATIRRKLKLLVDNGWLDERHNPKCAWDRTMQYRPNIVKIQHDLMEMGYVLDEYRLLSPEYIRGARARTSRAITQDDAPITHSAESITHSDGALPDTTTEITPDPECAPIQQPGGEQPLLLDETKDKNGAKAPMTKPRSASGPPKRKRRTKAEMEQDAAVLQPQTPQERQFFDRLQGEARTHGHNGAEKFQALQQAEDYRRAARILNGQYETVLSTALRRGIYSIDNVVGYLHAAANRVAGEQTADGKRILKIGQRF